MKLLRFGIDKFRLFKNQVWIDFSDQTILIGPNNEGKTTICDALNIFFSQLRTRGLGGRRIRRSEAERQSYIIERDYPASIHYGRKWPTKFTCKFEISTEDLKYLPDSQHNKKELTLIKRWSTDKAQFIETIEGVSDKDELTQISKYIHSKIKLITIPAIREESNLGAILEETFSQCIQARTENSIKIHALKKDLNNLLTPEINKTKNILNSTLNEFLKLPIKLDFEWDINISDSISLDQIKLDDGNLTNISLKGDGLKSIIQIALLAQYSNIENESKGTNIYIIEEPESHLNSAFIYNIKEQIQKLSKNSKVIITTHSPIFINFCDFETNILVQNGTVSLPKTKEDIANALGVTIQENLKSNLGAVYVEGYDDIIALNAILKNNNCFEEIKSKIDFIPAGGASKIPNVLSSNIPFYKFSYVLLDNDKAGREAIKSINIIDKNADIFISPLFDNFSESEIEDLLELNCVAEIFSCHFNREIDVALLNSVRKKYKGKWSHWILKLLNGVGIQLDDTLGLKILLWSNHDKIKFNETGSNFLNSLVVSLKNGIEKSKQ